MNKLFTVDGNLLLAGFDTDKEVMESLDLSAKPIGLCQYMRAAEKNRVYCRVDIADGGGYVLAWDTNIDSVSAGNSARSNRFFTPNYEPETELDIEVDW